MRWPAQQTFAVGANLPWQQYGCDFGANIWQPSGGVGQPARHQALRNALARLADCGVTVVRWFTLADGRAGLREASAGEVSGLDDLVFRDADVAVEELAKAGLTAIPVLFDFHWFRRARVVNGVRVGGRGHAVTDPARRADLLGHVVAPLLERYGQHPSIAAWDVINEPEWVTRGIRLPTRPLQVPRSAMRRFILEVVDLIHAKTMHAATVGSASARTLSLVEDLGLDVYQAHWYEHLSAQAPLERPVAEMGLDRPLILGEFPTRGSTRTPAEILETTRQAGYAGALAWSILSDDEASDGDALVAGLERFLAH